MKLIVGLGNPGTLYQYTRHNIGFLFLEYFASHHSFPAWKTNGALHGVITKTSELLLLKPDTYMNESGLSVSVTLSYFKVPITQLIVVHDDADLPFGEYKIQKDRGDAGHNGVKSISAQLKTTDYTRVRIGVRNPSHDGLKALAFVLSPFTEDERDGFQKLFEKISLELLQ